MARSSFRLGRKIPGVSTSTIWLSPSITTPRTGKRVVWTFWVTMETLVPTRRLTRVDLPALGAPITATNPARVMLRLPVRSVSAAACSAARTVGPMAEAGARSPATTSTVKVGACSEPIRPTVA